MSENNPNNRKVGVRIVRIGALDNAPSRKSALDREPTVRPLQRARAFGAPLATGSPRSLKPNAQAGVKAFNQAMADIPTSPMPTITDQADQQYTPGGINKTAAVLDLHEAAEEEIIWEQSYFPELTSDEEAPRWVTNAALSPTDAEFAALGAYVKYMVDGFSVFCRMPSVEESGNWHARLKMPQVVMPDTMLDVNISRLHARLRFETDHRVSRELITRYASQLQAQVIAALDDQREVEVTVW